MPILNYIRQQKMAKLSGIIFHTYLVDGNIELTRQVFSNGHLGLKVKRLYRHSETKDTKIIIDEIVREIGYKAICNDYYMADHMIIIDDTALRIRNQVYNTYRNDTDVIVLGSDFLNENFADKEEEVVV